MHHIVISPKRAALTPPGPSTLLHRIRLPPCFQTCSLTLPVSPPQPTTRHSCFIIHSSRAPFLGHNSTTTIFDNIKQRLAFRHHGIVIVRRPRQDTPPTTRRNIPSHCAASRTPDIIERTSQNLKSPLRNIKSLADIDESTKCAVRHWIAAGHHHDAPLPISQC